ncbi:MFS transporter [Microbacterium sp. 69-10]|uniref:MFS transporter n=1 Tax=Microbacterium sp. 69-10 TaxID=1895783 RepID=UPI0025FFF98A|nr:MFS transporter [Microbacterium sp. 69-10]
MVSVTSKKAIGRRQSVIVAVIGNFVEWYDWGLYGFLFPYFASSFFPGGESAARLSSLAVLAISFFMRPLGGAILGSYGDRHGRKAGLMLTILIMAGASLVIAVAPTYATVGLLAPALLIGARLVQGIATGGEYGASTAYLSEQSQARTRAFTASFQQVSVGIGGLAASLTVTVLASAIARDAMEQWGWRIGYAIGAVLGIIGFVVRYRASEPEAFIRLQKTATVSVKPFREMLTTQRKAALLLAGVSIGSFVTYYMWLTYLPAYTNLTTGLPLEQATGATSISLLVFICLLPLIARLSDRVGRRTTMLVYSIGTFVLILPLLLLLRVGTFWAMLTVALVGVILQAFASGTLTALYAELFPSRVRSVGVGFAYALTGALFGGTTPLIMEFFGSRGVFAFAPIYIMVLTAISTVVYIRMPETKGKDLE